MLTGMAAGLGLLVGLMALMAVRRLRRRLDALSQSYWELRYDYTRLRSQVARLDPDQPAADPADAAAQPAPAGPAVSFVPLSTIRKKDKSE